MELRCLDDEFVVAIAKCKGGSLEQFAAIIIILVYM